MKNVAERLSNILSIYHLEVEMLSLVKNEFIIVFGTFFFLSCHSYNMTFIELQLLNLLSVYCSFIFHIAAIASGCFNLGNF